MIQMVQGRFLLHPWLGGQWYTIENRASREVVTISFHLMCQPILSLIILYVLLFMLHF